MQFFCAPFDAAQRWAFVGGMGAIDRDKLVDEMTSDGEDLLGPSKSFIAELAVEEDGGATVLIGVKCRSMVVDFSDQALSYAKEYVPEEDDIKDIALFNDERPSAPIRWSRSQSRSWSGLEVIMQGGPIFIRLERSRCLPQLQRPRLQRRPHRRG